MKNIIFKFLLTSSVLLSGCSNPGQIQEYMARKKEPPKMIKIQDIKVTEETLTLDYRVSNPFDDDIRVCHAAWVYGNREVQHATTRIRDNTVRIILGNVVKDRNARELRVTQNPRPVEKYVRLAPGESYSGRVVLDLPIRDYSLEPAPHSRRPREENMDITLRRTVFEVGYFGPKLNKFFDTVSEMIKEKGIEPKTIVRGKYHYLHYDPLIAEEMLDGQSREVLYVGFSLENDEESVKVVLTDVAIPCYVVVDDK